MMEAKKSGEGSDGDKFLRLMLDVTTRCNIDCPVCYRSQKEDDIPLEEIEKIASEYKDKIFLICGGEPTVRDDLPEILKLIKKRNEAFLITNGLKLADHDYTMVLKEAGLKYIFFSLNGLDDAVYEKLNGRKMLDIKLQALENIKRAGMKVCLAVMIVRDVNDKKEDIKEIMDFAIKNRDFIREVRFRAMAPIGKFLPKKKYSMNELKKLVCDSLDVDSNDIEKEFEFRKELNKSFNTDFPLMPCSLNFYVRVSKGIHPLFKDVSLEKIKGSRLKKLLLISRGMSVYGPTTVLGGLSRIFANKRKIPWIHGKDVLTIGLRSTPDEIDFDLETNKKCPTGLYCNKKFISFCHANIIKDREWNDREGKDRS